MTDKETIEALIARDPVVTKQFFEDIRPILRRYINLYYNNPKAINDKEVANELYLHLLDKKARNLLTFEFKSSIFAWLNKVVYNFVQDLKKRGKVIEDVSREPLDNNKEPLVAGERVVEGRVERSMAKEQLQKLFDKMDNKRYVEVLRLLMIDELSYEEVADRLSVNVDNLYNIRRRAFKELTEVALKSK